MGNKVRKPKSFGIWGNTDKPRFWELLDPIMAWAAENNLTPFLTTRVQSQLPETFNHTFRIIESAEDFPQIDFFSTFPSCQIRPFCFFVGWWLGSARGVSNNLARTVLGSRRASSGSS